MVPCIVKPELDNPPSPPGSPLSPLGPCGPVSPLSPLLPLGPLALVLASPDRLSVLANHHVQVYPEPLVSLVVPDRPYHLKVLEARCHPCLLSVLAPRLNLLNPSNLADLCLRACVTFRSLRS